LKMPLDNITIEREGAIAIVTVNRPQALNALNQATLAELAVAIDEVAADDALRALIITGAGGRAFVAGADITELRQVESSTAAGRFSERAHAVLQKLVELPKPVIAAINGFALGGGLELALACDIRLAAEEAVLGLPEVSLGIMPGWGGTTRLVRLVGPGLAKLLIFTGGRVSAKEAQQLGIVERVVPAGELMTEARALATKIAELPPLAIAAAKQSINRSHDISLVDANAYEAALFGQLAVTDDAREGTTAFLEKRQARWKGR
jgi:enoyl-CoA hydratase